MTYREKLIATGFIKPLATRKTLRLDIKGRDAAIRHIKQYFENPLAFNTRPFQCITPEEFYESSDN